MLQIIKNGLFGIATALLFIATLSGCSALKKTQRTKKNQKVATKSSKQPKFIKGIYLDGHVKGNSTANAIDTRKVPPPLPQAPKIAEPIPAKYVEPARPQPVEIIIKKGNRQAPVTKTDEEPIAKVKESSPVQLEGNDDSKPIDMSSEYAMCKKYTDMIGIKCEEIVSIPLYKFVDKWYGTNYRLGGQTENGIDCSGFTQKLYGEVYNMELTRTAMDQYKSAERSKHAKDAEEGDLVFFRQRGKRITHVGVYLANDYFIHSSTSSGVIISSLSEDYWHDHYVGIGKMQKGR